MIDQRCRTFPWIGGCIANKTAPIAWEQICGPKTQGGLGLFNMLTWNVAALGKLLWALSFLEEKLWIQWVQAFKKKKKKKRIFGELGSLNKLLGIFRSYFRVERGCRPQFLHNQGSIR